VRHDSLTMNIDNNQKPWAARSSGLELRWVATPEGLRSRWVELASVPFILSISNGVLELAAHREESAAHAA
jgi:hypothetical protein